MPQKPPFDPRTAGRDATVHKRASTPERIDCVQALEVLAVTSSHCQNPPKQPEYPDTPRANTKHKNNVFAGAFMTNTATRRAIRVGEVPSSNLGAPIKKPRKCGVFCWGRAPWRALRLGSAWAVRAVYCQNAHSGYGEIGMVAWLSAYDLPGSCGEVPSTVLLLHRFCFSLQ
jgi:hypothetical protein